MLSLSPSRAYRILYRPVVASMQTHRFDLSVSFDIFTQFFLRLSNVLISARWLSTACRFWSSAIPTFPTFHPASDSTAPVLFSSDARSFSRTIKLFTDSCKYRLAMCDGFFNPYTPLSLTRNITQNLFTCHTFTSRSSTKYCGTVCCSTRSEYCFQSKS